MKMARYIDLSDRAKAALNLHEARKTDWDAEMLKIEKEAEKVRDVYIGKQADRMVATLRIEWLSMSRMKHFAATGENIAHRGITA